jgi:hypothetical protein
MYKFEFTFFTIYSCVNMINEAWMDFGLKHKAGYEKWYWARV